MNGNEDPRITGDQIRHFPSPTGDVTLVGVVHDHPASKYRVKTVIEERDPEIVALELPPLAIPLFEQYADDDRTPPVFGGEMSTAIQAASDRVVGIDGPSAGFLAKLLGNLYRNDVSLSTVRAVSRGLASVVKDAAVCRAASVFGTLTSIRLEVDNPVVYETGWNDDPERQAANERRQISRARSVMDAFEPSRAVSFRDSTRESHMTERLDELRRDGDVVAVVGSGHLSPVAERLADDPA